MSSRVLLGLIAVGLGAGSLYVSQDGIDALAIGLAVGSGLCFLVTAVVSRRRAR